MRTSRPSPSKRKAPSGAYGVGPGSSGLALPPAKREKALDLTCKNPTDEVESTTSDSGNQSGLEEGNSHRVHLNANNYFP